MSLKPQDIHQLLLQDQAHMKMKESIMGLNGNLDKLLLGEENLIN